MPIPKTISLGRHRIGPDAPCYVSIEAGATHSGYESAIRMIEAAADAGAQAIKFQIIDTDALMADPSTRIQYQTADGSKSEERVYDALKRRELPYETWETLKHEADARDLDFIATPSGPETIDFLQSIGAAAVKVAKSDINHRYLIEHMAKSGLPVILDAREKFTDVEAAVSICEAHRNENIIIMHCPSGYPAEHAGIHLDVIRAITHLFPYPAGYADHSAGMHMNFAALGMGARCIEKSVSLDVSTDAVEHSIGLEPSELSSFVRQVREVDAALGDSRVLFNSRVNPDHRRSIQINQDLPEGTTIQLEHLAFRRPGHYWGVEHYEEALGKRTKCALKAGSWLKPEHLESAID